MVASSTLRDIFDLDALWLRFSKPQPATSGGIYDWVGDYYPFGSFPSGPPANAKMVDTPVDSDGFRAGPIEWAAFALAAQSTIDEPGPATMIECGASQGLWALPWIRVLGGARAKRSGNPLTRNVRALAIEASASQDEAQFFWEAQDLEFKSSRKGPDLRFRGSNWDAEWIQRAVVAKDGPVYFPRVRADSDNGAQASNRVTKTDNRGFRVQHERVEGIRLPTLVARQKYIDFLHLDVQGTELEMLKKGEFESLRDRVGVMLLGTHSRASDHQALNRLPELGFSLLAEETCKFTRVPQRGDVSQGRSRYQTELIMDGEQLWVSDSVLERGQALGLIRR